MHFSISFIAASALISVASAAIFNVTVANNHQLNYDPPFLTGVKNGDIIGFKFASGTHTVTQSTFNKPCNKKDNGFDSGIMSSTNTPQWTITITDDSPSWFYCVPHCSRGMVFAINPTADQTFDAFSAAAKGLTPIVTTSSGTPSTVSSATAPVSTTPGATPAPGTATTTTSTGTTSPTNAGALGQISAEKVTLWFSTLGVIVSLML